MAKFRIHAVFDLEISNDEAAASLAAESIRSLVKAEEAKGTPIQSDLGSPEVASHTLAQEPKSAASLVVKEMIAKAADALPWVDVSNLGITHEG